MSELCCIALRKSYDALIVTDDLDLELHRGEVHALIGPNGAGKTTALAQLSGQLAPDSGRIMMGDRDVTSLSMPGRVHAGVARSYQISSIFASFGVGESVELALQAMVGHSFRFLRPASRAPGIRTGALALLDRVGLLDVAGAPASTLSHGQTRQLEIAMALASDPQVLLLDEPMAGMGPQEAESLAVLVAELGRERAVLLVEHDMDIVFSVADRISVLAEGSCIASGSPADIRADPEVQRLYLGDDDEDAGRC
ncbi:ABC transporter ATP-binding protein [soil metagenome]